MEPERLLLIGDVCYRLRLSPEAVRRLADAGVLPAQRTPGGFRIFRAGDVERVAEERARRRHPAVEERVG